MLEYYRFKVINNLFLKGQTEAACLQLRELQKRYVNLCEENATIKANLREYEDILYLARNFTFDGQFYWLRTGSIKQGPFCPICYDKDGQLVRINEMHPRRCASCGEIFEQAVQEEKQHGSGRSAYALEQGQAVSPLRAIAALEQLAQARAVQEELAAVHNSKPARGKATILPFVR